jgi:cytochrome c oxidase assembly protein subunit 15
MLRSISRLSWPARLAWFAALFALCVVVFGAFVRLSNAGLSCPDWPTCYGQVTWPHQAHQVARADAAFPQRPVEPGKPWREQFHRMIAGTLGVLVLVLALIAVWRKPWARWTVIGAAAAAALGTAMYIGGEHMLSSALAALSIAAPLVVAAPHTPGDLAAQAHRGHRASARRHGHVCTAGVYRAADHTGRRRRQ